MRAEASGPTSVSTSSTTGSRSKNRPTRPSSPPGTPVRSRTSRRVRTPASRPARHPEPSGRHRRGLTAPRRRARRRDRRLRARPAGARCRSPRRVPPADRPGVGWVLADTIAAEIGDISRFASPKKLVGYTGLCPRVYPSGGGCAGARSEERTHLSPLGPHRGVAARLQPPALQARLRADEGPPRPQPGRQGRPGRARPQARRVHLAHAHDGRTLRSGEVPGCASGRVTALHGVGPPERSSHPTGPPSKEAREMRTAPQNPGRWSARGINP